MAIKTAGDLQILTTSWNSNAVLDTDYTKCRLPFSGTDGNGTHGVVMFLNTQGYGRMVGRCYITLSISQNHSGYFDFYLSRYGGGITNQHNTNWCAVKYVPNIGGNINYHGFVWYNTNGNSWGNGTLHYRVEAWGGGLKSGQFDQTHGSGYYNFQGFTGQAADKPFARRLN